jgi:hypothetical protein
MKKEVFYSKTQPDPLKVEECEPLIIWILRLNGNFFYMPELHFLIQTFYWEN